MKKWLYQAATPLLEASLKRKSAVIGLCYHRFEPAARRDPVAGMAIAPDQFRMHLDVFSSMGQWVSVGEAASGNKGAGIRLFLTFDDGYRDNLTVLLPILEEYQVPVCVYVVGGLADKTIAVLDHDKAAGYAPPMLSPEELRELGSHPLVTLGSHTQHHPRLSALSKEDVAQEIRLGMESLERVTGNTLDHFAVPFGGQNDARWAEVQQAATQLGLKSVASNFGGWNRSDVDGSMPVLLNRVSMGPIAEAWNVRGWVAKQASFGGNPAYDERV